MKRRTAEDFGKRNRREPSGFRRGIGQFNGGQFFEAHESWEAVWLKSVEPERTFLQGLIQIAAAFHHWNRGNLRGARSLLRAGLNRLAAFPAEYDGIALKPFREAALRWQDLLDQGHDSESPRVSPQPLPKIKTVSAGSAASKPWPRDKRDRH